MLSLWDYPVTCYKGYGIYFVSNTNEYDDNNWDTEIL